MRLASAALHEGESSARCAARHLGFPPLPAVTSAQKRFTSARQASRSSFCLAERSAGAAGGGAAAAGGGYSALGGPAGGGPAGGGGYSATGGGGAGAGSGSQNGRPAQADTMNAAIPIRTRVLQALRFIEQIPQTCPGVHSGNVCPPGQLRLRSMPSGRIYRTNKKQLERTVPINRPTQLCKEPRRFASRQLCLFRRTKIPPSSMARAAEGERFRIPSRISARTS